MYSVSLLRLSIKQGQTNGQTGCWVQSAMRPPRGMIEGHIITYINVKALVQMTSAQCRSLEQL